MVHGKPKLELLATYLEKNYERRKKSAEAGGLGRLDPGPETGE